LRGIGIRNYTITPAHARGSRLFIMLASNSKQQEQ
jgi:hypothetical protein